MKLIREYYLGLELLYRAWLTTKPSPPGEPEFYQHPGWAYLSWRDHCNYFIYWSFFLRELLTITTLFHSWCAFSSIFLHMLRMSFWFEWVTYCSDFSRFLFLSLVESAPNRFNTWNIAFEDLFRSYTTSELGELQDIPYFFPVGSKPLSGFLTTGHPSRT